MSDAAESDLASPSSDALLVKPRQASLLPSSSVRCERDFDVWDPSVAPEENLYFWKGEPKILRRPPVGEGELVSVELFSGCGGTSLGFEMAGFVTGVGLDIHAPSVETFHANHRRASTVLADVDRVRPATILDLLGGRRPDVLIAGIPCQGFSLNNRKRTDADKRNLLFLQLLRFVEALRPRAVVVENVGGLRSAGAGQFARDISQGLERAGDLRVSSTLLLAAEFGVPQMRRRLVFVGVSDGEAFDFRALRRTHGPTTGREFLTVRDALGDLPSLAAGEEATRYASLPANPFQELMRRGASRQLKNHRAPNHPAETIERIRSTRPGDPMYPRFKQRIRLSWDAPSPTQVSGGIRPQFQFGHPADARGLTIRERCRIQSFPDSFEVAGGIVQGRVQTGNAVPPLLAMAIATHLRERLT